MLKIVYNRKNKKDLQVEIDLIFKELMEGEVIGIKTPAFQFWFQDFISGTTSMKAAEAGAYIFLLIRQWDKWGLDDDINELKETGRCDDIVINKVLKKFILCPDGKYRNKRLEEVRAEQIANRKALSTGGVNGNKKRWGGKDEVKETTPVIPTNKPVVSDESGNFFKIGIHLFKYPVSKYIIENMPQFLEIWEVQNKPLKPVDVLKLMDKQYVGHDYTNENHIKNTFKLVGKSMLKTKPNDTQAPQKSGINYGKKQ